MALVPGSPGSYNPGGGGGAGLYPWWGFALFPIGAGMGMGIARTSLAATRLGTGIAYRVTSKSLFKKGLTYQGPAGLLEWKQDKDRIEFGMDVFRLGHYIHTTTPVEESSSLTDQQNGGSSAPPPLVITGGGRESRPLSGVSQGTPSRKLRGRSRRGRCPPGHRWNGRRCVKIR